MARKDEERETKRQGYGREELEMVRKKDKLKEKKTTSNKCQHVVD